MTTLVSIEATSVNYAVSVCNVASGNFRHAASTRMRRDEPGFRSLGALVETCLAEAGCAFADVDLLAVDVGPGNLSAARSAISYANGLAFSLGIRIWCANSLEIMAAAVTEQVPVLSVRHAHGGCIFAGFYRPGKDPELRHGVVDVVVPALVGDADKVSLAGPPRDDVLAALAATETSVVGTGIEYPDVRVLQKMCTAALSDPRRLVDLASPMTETSAVFGDARTTLSRK